MLIRKYILALCLVPVILCAQPAVSVEWAVAAGPVFNRSASPVVSPENDVVYFGNCNEDPSVLYAFNTHNGSLKWKVSLPLDDRTGFTLRDKLHSMRIGGSNDILICAHRANTLNGILSKVPENSLAAIQECVNAGIEMVELDVRTTKDGYLVIMHDESINRTTTGSGLVKDKTLAQLKELFLVAADGSITNQRIPTLTEALTFGAGKIWFNLDLARRNLDPQRVVDEVMLAGLLNEVVFFHSSDTVTARLYLLINDSVMIHPSATSTSQIRDYTTLEPFANSIQLIQISTTNTQNTDLPIEVVNSGRILFTNALGIIDSQLRNNNFGGIKTLLDKNVRIIQSDYGDKLKDYLKSRVYLN